MKKNILLSLAAIAALMVSCTPTDDTPTVKGSITAETVEYTIPTAGTEEVEQFIEFTTNAAWTATVKGDWLSITPKKGEAGEGKIKLIADANKTNDTLVATVVVTVEGAVKEFTVTQLQKDAFSLVAESATIGADGGEVELKVMTNVAYDVTIPEDAIWIKKFETKAYGEQVTKLVVDAYAEIDATRSATLTVAAKGFEPLSFTLTQNGLQTKVWSVDLRTVMNHVATFEKTYGDDSIDSYSTVVSLALYDGNLVVCAGDGSNPVILDKKTGEKKGELNTGDIVPVTITNDEAGNLVFCNRVWNWWNSRIDFSIWYMKPGESAPEKLVSTQEQDYGFGPSYIGYSLSVRGDVTKDAVVVAPFEGVAGVTGEKQILAWNVKDGVAGSFIKQDITGFSFSDGYWFQSPNNSPAYALLGTTLEFGALFGVYGENSLYQVSGEGSCSLLKKDAIDGNHALNAIEIRTVGDKMFLAIAAETFFDYSNPQVILVDVATQEILYECESIRYGEFGSGNTGCDVTLESAEGGVNVYYIANNSAAIEAFHIPVE